ncbi:MAG: T9SS type A sorting domain-containing protein [Bacteroidales bacterium]|nr:T9SS type A sorting domain-containing protein [Bacteroidales bacterium]
MKKNKINLNLKVQLIILILTAFIFNISKAQPGNYNFNMIDDSLYYPIDIVYDTLYKRYLVSNWGDGNGNILVINTSGEVIDNFFDGLDYAGGMCIIDDILYVINNGDLVGGSLPSSIIEIDINTGKQLSAYEICNSCYLNLIDTDHEGNLYIPDQENGKIYKYNIANHSVTDLATNIVDPFGLCYDESNNRIVFTSGTFQTSKIISVSVYGGEQTILATFPYGYLEGIIKGDSGNYYLSSWGNDFPWGNESIYMYNNSFTSFIKISTNHNRPFGLCYRNDTLIVANWGDHTISFIDLSPFAIKEFDNLSDFIEIYPNPNKGEFNLNISDFMNKKITIGIYDILGKQIFISEEKVMTPNYKKSIDLTTFHKGTYILKVQSKTGIYRDKIIIQ